MKLIQTNQNEIPETLEHDNETLKSYLYRSLIADDFLDIYFIENKPCNEIERKLAKALKKVFTSEDFENQGLRLTDDINISDAVIFMLSEHLSEESVQTIQNLDDDVVKIGFITSAAQNQYDFTDIDNLLLVTQGVNSHFPLKKLKNVLKISKDTKIVGLPLSPFINVARESNVRNYLTLDFQKYTAEIGLYELIATSLPSQYSGVKIKCPDIDTAIKLKDHFIYTADENIFVDEKSQVCITDNSQTTKEDEVLQQHATIKLLKIIRQTLEANQ